MIAAMLLALAAPPANATTAPRPPNRVRGCRGVHMPNGEGGANLLWTTIRGPAGRLASIAERMRAIGAGVDSRGPNEILARYTDNLDARAIGRLLNAIDAGEFGPVTTEDFAMSLDTLPADRCIRFPGPSSR